jgi:hypothetical protein
MDRIVAWHKYLLILVFSTFLVGCAGAPTSQAPSSRGASTTDLLIQSGFQAEPASQGHLQKLPGNQFVTVQRQGRTYYVFADPGTKQLYFGSEAAYQRYQSLAAAQAAEAQQVPVSSESNMSAFDWTMYRSLRGIGP